MLIISIVIFSGSLYFVQQFYKTTTQTREEIDRQTDSEIQALLRGGTPVAVPISKKTIPRGKDDTFWIGIENILQNKEDFYVKVCFSNAYDANGQILINADPPHIQNNWLLYDQNPVEIAVNQYKPVSLLVRVDDRMAPTIGTEKGTYAFNVYVAIAPIPDACDTDWYNNNKDRIYFEPKRILVDV